MSESGNSLFSTRPLTPLMPTGKMKIAYEALFDIDSLGLWPGEELGVETLLTFSGPVMASQNFSYCGGRDFNGDGRVSTVDNFAATTACHASMRVPLTNTAFETSTLSIADAGETQSQNSPEASVIFTTGALIVSDIQTSVGKGEGKETISGNIARGTTAAIVGMGSAAGEASSCASITFGNNVSADPNDLNEVDCATVFLDARSKVKFRDGEYCTYNQAGWVGAASRSVGESFDDNFDFVLPSVLLIGGTPSVTFSSPSALRFFLPATGAPGRLTQSLLDPYKTSAGRLTGEVVALKLNLVFGTAGLLPASSGSIGVLTLSGMGNAFDGATVGQILTLAEEVLSTGKSFGVGIDYKLLSDTLHRINAAFSGCRVSRWAQAHLSR